MCVCVCMRVFVFVITYTCAQTTLLDGLIGRQSKSAHYVPSTQDRRVVGALSIKVDANA